MLQGSLCQLMEEAWLADRICPPLVCPIRQDPRRVGPTGEPRKILVRDVAVIYLSKIWSKNALLDGISSANSASPSVSLNNSTS